jgi:carboxyl-terminal processing protease
MNKKRLSFQKIRVLILVMVIGVTSLAITKSDLFQQIARSQRLINNVYKYLITNYVDEIDIETFTRASIRQMVNEMDPYTVYLEEEEREGIELLTSGKYGGVGIQIGKREGQLTVIAPMDDTPAQRAGIISGDIIIKIDDLPTTNLGLDEAAKKIRGMKGTTVRLTIQRYGEDEPLEFVLVREDIRVKDVTYTGMLNDTDGYIRLTRFSKNAPSEMEEALRELMNRDAESIILDLRDNPGGLLTAAVEILDMFVPKGELLLSTKGRVREANQTFYAKKRPIVPEFVKVTVLINSGSASASEIVAGTLQDLDRAVIVGQPSFGKGLVQTVYSLDDKRSLKITTAKYYIPSGRLIQKPGYVDEELILEEEQVDSVFTTAGGRVVKGGGGITPDHLEKGDKIPPLTRECWRRGAFFSYVQKHRNDYQTLAEVQADPELLEKFRDYLREIELDVPLAGETPYLDAKDKLLSLDSTNADLQSAFRRIDRFIAAKEAALFDEEADWLEFGLYQEFASIYEGTEGRFRVSLERDKVLQAALEILHNQVAYKEIFTTHN